MKRWQFWLAQLLLFGLSLAGLIMVIVENGGGFRPGNAEFVLKGLQSGVQLPRIIIFMVLPTVALMMVVGRLIKVKGPELIVLIALLCLQIYWLLALVSAFR